MISQFWSLLFCLVSSLLTGPPSSLVVSTIATWNYAGQPRLQLRFKCRGLHINPTIVNSCIQIKMITTRALMGCFLLHDDSNFKSHSRLHHKFWVPDHLAIQGTHHLVFTTLDEATYRMILAVPIDNVRKFLTENLSLKQYIDKPSLPSNWNKLCQNWYNSPQVIYYLHCVQLDVTQIRPTLAEGWMDQWWWCREELKNREAIMHVVQNPTTSHVIEDPPAGINITGATEKWHRIWDWPGIELDYTWAQMCSNARLHWSLSNFLKFLHTYL